MCYCHTKPPGDSTARPHLDAYLSSCAVAVSCSSSSEAERLVLLLEQLQGRVLLRRLRNLFGSMAAAQSATYDEHGWITVVQGGRRGCILLG